MTRYKVKITESPPGAIPSGRVLPGLNMTFQQNYEIWLRRIYWEVDVAKQSGKRID